MKLSLTQALDTAAEPRQMLLSHLQQAPVAVSLLCQRCCSTAQGWIPQHPDEHLPGCTTPFPAGTAFPRHRQGLEAQTAGRLHLTCRLKTANTSTQTRFLGSGMARQTCLLEAVTRCITSPQHMQGWGSSRSGLCPLPKYCSRRVFVNGELKSRDQLLCTQGCGEGWTRGSGPSHAFNTKQLLIFIAT